jgi:hypothetical protein
MIDVKSVNVRYRFEVDENVTFVIVGGKRICTLPHEDINRIANVLTHLWNIKESERRIAEISNPASEPEF